MSQPIGQPQEQAPVAVTLSAKTLYRICITTFVVGILATLRAIPLLIGGLYALSVGVFIQGVALAAFAVFSFIGGQIVVLEGLENPCAELGLSDGTFNKEKITKAWRHLAKEHHPDKGGDPAKFQRISQAHDILKIFYA